MIKMHYDNIPLSINMGTYLVMTKVRREIIKLRDSKGEHNERI